MNPLPLVLHQEILSFLNDNDGFEYCKVSKRVKCEIGKRVGSITLLNKKNIKDFLTSESHRTDILKNLHDSLRQLNICHYEPRDFVITSFDRDEAYNRFDEGSLASLPSLSLHSLCAKSREVFIILQNIKRIHKLTLHNPNPKDTSFSERDSDLFYRIVHLLSSPDHDYGLKELILYYFPIPSIPIFPNLINLELFGINNITAEQINISSFPNLRRLKLSGCSGIVDVTSLGYIYDLEIVSCNGIIDISPLNNNYRVTIKTCQRIHDFSKSFQFSREICLKPIFFNPQETKPLDLNRLQAVVSLEIENEFCKTLPIVHNGTFPPSLRTLILEKLQFSFPLPETHNLKFIQLHRCSEVSLVNMTKIAKVVLIECNDIRFYSRLSHNKFVRIVNCNFRDSKGLHNIKHLEVKMPLDLNQPEIRNITHLCYDLWMALDKKRFDSLLRSLLLSKVQTLEFNVGIDVNIAVDLILTLLIQLKRDRILQKVVIRIVGRRVIRYFAQDLGRAETFQQLADVYNLEYTSNYRELVLLKKRVE